MIQIKKLILVGLLLLTSCAALGAEVKIEVINVTQHLIHVAANNHITVSPRKIYPHSFNEDVVFSNVNSTDSFEIYFRTTKYSDVCIFTYDLHKGLSPKQCNERRYTVSADGASIKFTH